VRNDSYSKENTGTEEDSRDYLENIRARSAHASACDRNSPYTTFSHQEEFLSLMMQISSDHIYARRSWRRIGGRRRSEGLRAAEAPSVSTR